ncbi:hypothetical protein SERLA73DRAFT_172618 [Serpula lacrymans var. lacrymans S7.3]|uniref:Uncharacterized protein n=2 Tax=Serpula lacrymans var. lacrymans TaxID=341189 RepID=F8QG04_SERL3|nr:uncharacterized protein SERLADRAFT_385057 [Serpula lacrymans var. lacrymans S7.9]EGN92752.1 hypothetical protein SERLA73DRAFT_172618 [Serpula lacrymans var. lacrymans S7.3]EGO26413.1 hypothetical protein SERLADRAFT_385057 [Serpula lacrymans var. lacrymans S7.9]
MLLIVCIVTCSPQAFSGAALEHVVRGQVTDALPVRQNHWAALDQNDKPDIELEGTTLQ